jgi:hypothetical protein
MYWAGPALLVHLCLPEECWDSLPSTRNGRIPLPPLLQPHLPELPEKQTARLGQLAAQASNADYMAEGLGTGLSTFDRATQRVL